MIESWDEWANRKRKKYGIPKLIKPILEVVSPKPRCAKPLEEMKSPRRRFNIHKRSLPPGIDKVVIYGVESKVMAEQIIERTTNKRGDRIFNTKLYKNDATELDTYVFYKPVPTDATPRERSIHFNSGDIVTDPIPGYKGPTRVN